MPRTKKIKPDVGGKKKGRVPKNRGGVSKKKSTKKIDTINSDVKAKEIIDSAKRNRRIAQDVRKCVPSVGSDEYFVHNVGDMLAHHVSTCNICNGCTEYGTLAPDIVSTIFGMNSEEFPNKMHRLRMIIERMSIPDGFICDIISKKIGINNLMNFDLRSKLFAQVNTKLANILCSHVRNI